MNNIKDKMPRVMSGEGFPDVVSGLNIGSEINTFTSGEGTPRINFTEDLVRKRLPLVS